MSKNAKKLRVDDRAIQRKTEDGVPKTQNSTVSSQNGEIDDRSQAKESQKIGKKDKENRESNEDNEYVYLKPANKITKGVIKIKKDNIEFLSRDAAKKENVAIPIREKIKKPRTEKQLACDKRLAEMRKKYLESLKNPISDVKVEEAKKEPKERKRASKKSLASVNPSQTEASEAETEITETEPEPITKPKKSKSKVSETDDSTDTRSLKKDLKKTKMILELKSNVENIKRQPNKMTNDEIRTEQFKKLVISGMLN